MLSFAIQENQVRAWLLLAADSVQHAFTFYLLYLHAVFSLKSYSHLYTNCCQTKNNTETETGTP